MFQTNVQQGLIGVGPGTLRKFGPWAASPKSHVHPNRVRNASESKILNRLRGLWRKQRPDAECNAMLALSEGIKILLETLTASSIALWATHEVAKSGRSSRGFRLPARAGSASQAYRRKIVSPRHGLIRIWWGFWWPWKAESVGTTHNGYKGMDSANTWSQAW